MGTTGLCTDRARAVVDPGRPVPDHHHHHHSHSHHHSHQHHDHHHQQCVVTSSRAASGYAALLMLHGGLLVLLLARVAGGKALLDSDGGRQDVEQSLDGCDRSIWSPAFERRAVHQLQVRCSEGTVWWRQADGALRLLLESPAPLKKGKQLETCLAISSHLLRLVVSTDTHNSQAMVPLALLTMANPRTGKDLCIRSESPVSIFMETQPGEPDLGLGYVHIRYDVTSISKNDQDKMEECRPCTDDELLLMSCSLDFVISGKMGTVLHSNILQQTTIDIDVNKVYRQKGHHFTDPHEHSRLKRDNELTNLSESYSSEIDLGHGTINAPYKCGIRYGEGEFLFIGRMRLGKALLQCAPRMEEFNEVWHEAVRTGHNLCNLD